MQSSYFLYSLNSILAISFGLSIQPLFNYFFIIAFKPALKNQCDNLYIGFVILICIIPVYKAAHPKKAREPKKINWGIVLTWTIGVVGSLIMGFGMSKIMVGDAETADMIVGIITGVVGLVICLLKK